MIFDLHCDLLSYLTMVPNANPMDGQALGCALPHLQTGGVKLQTLAIYAPVKQGSSQMGWQQVEAYQQLLIDYAQFVTGISDLEGLMQLMQEPRTGFVVAIESGSGFCEEDQRLETGLRQLEQMIASCGGILYISLTHHAENRFGGGNYAEAGLKADGEVLLDFLHGRGIAADLSHASDALAHDIFNYIDKKGLDVPVIASHSNFREIENHVRNLPEALYRELINRQGLIGMNFLRQYVHPTNPDALTDHIIYGLENGAGHVLAMGADYFHTKSYPDPKRIPFFFPEHEDATCYSSVLEKVSQQGVEQDSLEAMAFGNVYRYLERTWS